MDQDKKANCKPPATGYAELRSLLFPEGEDLSRLHVRLSDRHLRAEDVSEVLPSALQLGAERSTELRSALRPLVEQSIQASIHNDPGILLQALFPLVGAALRKAASSALESAHLTLNRWVERNLSFRGFGWRWEAFTEGQPFDSIALSRSCLFRVEQVFLVHRSTGLVLHKSPSAGSALLDAGLTPEMLTAMQESDTLRIGESVVWIQHGVKALLLAVIRGNPPHRLNTVLMNALEHIHHTLGPQLEQFNGETGPFVAAEADLRDCLLGRAPEVPRGVSPLWWIAVAILLEGLAFLIFTNVRDHWRWDNYLARVQNQAGVVVTAVEKHGSSYVVSGLRDPLSVDPATLLAGSGIDPKHVAFHWELYHSLQPSFEAERRLINQVQTVENQSLHFGPASSELSDGDIAAVDLLATQIHSMLSTAHSLHRKLVVEVVGHTDGVGAEKDNEGLAQARAETVILGLIEAGVSTDVLTPKSAGSSVPLRRGNSETDLLFNRYVSFHVVPAHQ